ncbi:site-specific DNA-methyltransferase [Faecalitalea cylindroides]|uniref:Site-specific DNA-methyltransferase n=1 Tax=Faecalitalea cylindroides TaxID=39483 RepID=A0A1Y4LVF5_9FIRM|nr:site-specific DNA-methyltransferase [Faecalitalea cylindroides]OUP60615.1 site-specific DNA-methyltransferase [Faecalitalea cylindroides]
MEKINDASLDLTKVNIEKLKELFPNVVTEGKIDFDVLRTILGDDVDDSKEKYQFTWKGKNAAIKLAQSPSSATLRPDKNSSKNWDTTENLYIEGDNLEVLKQLQKTYYGKIKMIYIDPPYNTGNDFVYHDNFMNSIKSYKEQTSQEMSSNPETNGRFHTDWLNMMYSRILLAKNLLTSDGFMYISIDDNEIGNLLKICDEIFGKDCFVGNICRATGTTTAQGTESLGKSFDYVVCYSKKSNYSMGGFDLDEKDKSRYNYEDEKGKFSILQLRRTGGEDRREDRPSMFFGIETPDGKIVYPKGPTGYDSRWRVGKETYEKMLKNNEIYFKKNDDGSYSVYYKFYLEGRTKRPSNLWTDIEGNKKAQIDLKSLINEKVFDTPKPLELIYKLSKISMLGNNDIVLDFFSGSATTAHAIMNLNAKDNGNRKFIMVQLPELCDKKTEAYKAGYKNICEIGKERIRRAGEQIKIEWEKKHPSDTLLSSDEKLTTDIGFKVFKLDSTNLIAWDNESEMSEDDLFTLSDVFKEGRTKEDILYEIILKYGVFDMPVTEIVVNGKTMYRVGKRYMIVCLENEITSEDVEAISELSPKSVVFKEDGFKNDNDKINAEYNLQKAGVEDIKCI